MTFFLSRFVYLDCSYHEMLFHVGDKLFINYQLKSKLPTPKVKAFVDVYSLEEQKVLTTLEVFLSNDVPSSFLEYSFYKIGTMEFRLKKFVVQDFFHIVQFKRKQDLKVVVTVYPAPEAIYRRDVLEELLEGDQPIDERGKDYTEIYELKEYREGDEFNHIHHALSAKYDSYIIKIGSEEKKPMYVYKLDHQKRFVSLEKDLSKIFEMFLIVVLDRGQFFAVDFKKERHYVYSHEDLYQVYDLIYREYQS